MASYIHVHAYRITCTHIFPHLYTLMYTHKHSHTHAHSYIHTFTHTFTHLYTHSIRVDSTTHTRLKRTIIVMTTLTVYQSL